MSLHSAVAAFQVKATVLDLSSKEKITEQVDKLKSKTPAEVKTAISDLVTVALLDPQRSLGASYKEWLKLNTEMSGRVAESIDRVKTAIPNATVAYLSEVNSVLAKSHEEISVEILATLIQERKSSKLTPETFNRMSNNVINAKTPEVLSDADLIALTQRSMTELNSKQIKPGDPVAVQKYVDEKVKRATMMSLIGKQLIDWN